MPAELKTAARPLGAAGGAGFSGVAARVVEGRGGKLNTLYCVAEAQGVASAEVCQQVLEVVAAAYRSAGRVSSTSRLTAAINAAHRFLCQENASRLRQHPCLVGITCAVFQGDALYLAQAGPCLAYVRRRGRWARFPGDGATPAAPEPLGAGEAVEIHLARSELAAGDAIIIAAPSLAEALEEEVRKRRWGLGREAAAAPGHLSQSPRAQDAGLVIEVLGERAGASRGRQHREPGVSRHRREDGAPEHRPLPRGDRVAGARPGSGAGRARRLALAAAVTAVLLLLLINLWPERQRQIEAGRLLAAAEKISQEAAQTPEAATQRRLLRNADSLVAQARAAGAGADQARLLEERIRSQLERSYGVVRLNYVRALLDFGRQASASEPADLAVDGLALYVLDGGLGRVYKYMVDPRGEIARNGAASVLWQAGEQRGGAALGQPQGLFWMPRGRDGSPGRLLAWESEGRLLAYDARRGPWVVKQLGAVGGGVVRLAGHEGQLYALGAPAPGLWQFPPAPDGYGKPQPYFGADAEMELAGVVDLAVDGSVYLLYADGLVGRYYGGRPLPFSGRPPDAPIRRPTAIFTSAQSRWVYVADAGNKRIVRFSKDGQFQEQFRDAGGEEALANLKKLFVDEEGGRLYFISGPKVYLAPLPP